jgi:hypothetical protein
MQYTAGDGDGEMNCLKHHSALKEGGGGGPGSFLPLPSLAMCVPILAFGQVRREAKVCLRCKVKVLFGLGLCLLKYNCTSVFVEVPESGSHTPTNLLKGTHTGHPPGLTEMCMNT